VWGAVRAYRDRVTAPLRRDAGPANGGVSWLVDVSVAGLFTLFVVLASVHVGPERHAHALDGFGYGIVAAAGVSLVFARRYPWPVVAFLGAAFVAYLVDHNAGGPVFATLLVGLFWLGDREPRRDAFVAAAVLSVAVVLAGVATGRDEPLMYLVFVGWAGAAVFLGDALGARREHLAEARAWAGELERTREAEAARRVAEERLRIARDLHDSVAHSMATINVQAGAAAHVVDRRPQAAKEALAAIQQASGEVLEELAALLGLLRGGHVDDRAPVPSLSGVGDLVELARTGGLDVTLAADGLSESVAQPVSAAAYRVVQESLTNVVRHAGGARADVCLVVGEGMLEVSVVDGGGKPGSATSGLGMGLLGMRERVAATGGTLEAGPRPGGGFGVVARWPRR
jgi:signal transduction histidine kinase